MLRHFQLFAAAPGREAEAEQALSRWLDDISDAHEFRGGAILREYAGEFGDIQGALAVLYDVDSREAGADLRKAIAEIPNPMTPDGADVEPADQGAVLFTRSNGHAQSQQHGSEPTAADLRFDRGGGLLARLMHGHFRVITSTAPSTDLSTPIENGASGAD